MKYKKPDEPENQNKLNLTSNNLDEEKNRQTRMTFSSSQNPKTKITQNYNHGKQINESKMMFDSLYEQNIQKQPWITESSKNQKIKVNIPQRLKNMSTQKTKRKNISEENLSVDKQDKFLKNRQTNRIYLTRNTKTALQVKKKNALNGGMSCLKR